MRQYVNRNVPDSMLLRIDKDSPIPKYYQIYQSLESILAQGAYDKGDRFLSEKQIAGLFHVDRGTVRKAIEMFMHQGILNREQGRGTFVGQKFARGPETIREKDRGSVALLIVRVNDYYEAFINSLENELSSRGYVLQLYCTHYQREAELKCLQDAASRQVSGIVFGCEADRDAVKHFYPRVLQEVRVPLMLIVRRLPNADFDYVEYDYFQGAKRLGEHLIGQGHQRIIFVGASENNYAYESRLAGLRSALEEQGLDLPEERVFPALCAVSDLTRLKELFMGCSEPATAVVGAMDAYAQEMHDVLKLLGLDVPDDVALVGFDNSKIGVSMEVPLTTVSPPQVQAGQMAAQKILEKIAGVQEPVRISLPCSLVIRNSCGSAKRRRSEYLNPREMAIV